MHSLGMAGACQQVQFTRPTAALVSLTPLPTCQRGLASWRGTVSAVLPPDAGEAATTTSGAVEPAFPNDGAQSPPINLERVGRKELARTGRLLNQGKQRAWEDLHKPAGLVMFPAWLLGSMASIMEAPHPVWIPVVTGGAIGGLFAVLNRYCKMRYHAPPRAPLGVVLTGGSKGLGKALARELLVGGDRVLLTSRTHEGLEQSVGQLKEELGDAVVVYGFKCDVSCAADVEALEQEAVARLGRVDVWINNAGYSGSFQPFIQQAASQVQQVVSTNLLGVALCSRQAALLFSRQQGGGHLFNVDGAGADGFATPNYAAYGSTKAAIRQLSMSLQQELKNSDTRIHLLSPGMILTDLLLEGATTANKQAFNILCEQPETTAAFLVPRIRTVVARNMRNTYVRYLTPASAMWRLLTCFMRVGQYFDAEGNPVYPDELERMYGKGAKATARRVAAARRQNQGLAVAYSLSLAFAAALLVVDANIGMESLHLSSVMAFMPLLH